MNDSFKNNTHGNFTIGQVVYVLSNKNQSIVPAMIVEESVITTLEKKIVSWKLAIGSKRSDKPQKIVESTKVDGEIYSDLSAVHTILKNRLMNFLNTTISEVQKREKVWYGTVSKKIVADEPQRAQAPRAPSTEQTAVSKPVAQKPNSQQQPQNAKIDLESFLDEEDSVATTDESDEVKVEVASELSELEIKEKLRKMVLSDDSDIPAAPGEEKIRIVDQITGPDGMLIPINLKV